MIDGWLGVLQRGPSERTEVAGWMVQQGKGLGNMAQTTSRTGILTTAPSTPVAGAGSPRGMGKQ